MVVRSVHACEADVFEDAFAAFGRLAGEVGRVPVVDPYDSASVFDGNGRSDGGYFGRRSGSSIARDVGKSSGDVNRHGNGGDRQEDEKCRNYLAGVVPACVRTGLFLVVFLEFHSGF